tara:strand:- start:530 stop:1048 length:519 start_codon:yes stop_codon:yes gene_type:complete
MSLATKEINKLFSEKQNPAESPTHDKAEVQEYSDNRFHASENKEDLEPSTPRHDKELKSIFRKIAAKIHPDKQESLNPGSEKEKNTLLFNRATKARDDGDIAILFDIAADLSLNFTVNEDIIKKTEKKITHIKNRLQKIESTYVWSWFFTSDEIEKQKILEELFKLMYEKIK